MYLRMLSLQTQSIPIQQEHSLTEQQKPMWFLGNVTTQAMQINLFQRASCAIALKIDASKFRSYRTLPASPVTGVFYFVKE